jgi:glucose 1-dehydrogenase
MAARGGPGKIIIIGSILADIPMQTSAAYNMAKAAINHLGRTLAAELTRQRINVNVINPGYIDTPGERAFASEEEIRRTATQLPWGRLGTPRDIGRAAAFLASDDADYITGSVLQVDGGYKLAMRLGD